MKAQYLLTLLLLNLANMTFAATCESTLASGQWSQTSTWINCNGMVPQDGDSVIVNNGHTVILDQNTALIESLTVVGGGDINVAATGFSINTDADGADINLQNATIELSGDLTINANGHKILLGSVDGAFDLTLNSSNETRFLGKIGGITELTSLITDSPGTTVFADTSAGTSTPNLKVNGLIEFNDPMLIAQRVIFSGNNTSVYFNNKIDSETTAKDLYILASVNSTFIFNDDVGTNTRLGAIKITNNVSSMVVFNTENILTSEFQWYTAHMLLKVPNVNLDSTSTGLSFLLQSPTVRSEVAGMSGLTVNTNGSTHISSTIGDNNQALAHLNIANSISNDLKSNSVTVIDSITFASPIILKSSTVLNAAIVDIQSTLDNGGFDIVFNTTDTNELSKVFGVISGTGDLTKEGLGDLSFYGVNSMTGDLFINSGSVINKNAATSIFPGVTEFSLAINAEAYLGSGGTSSATFELNNGQLLKGEGVCYCNLLVKSGATLSPGFSPGLLGMNGLNMETGSTLVVELNGTILQSEYDSLSSSQAVALEENTPGGATLDLSLGFLPEQGDKFTLINNTSGSAITGMFMGLPEGTEIPFGGTSFSISYVGGAGNDVELTALGPQIYYVNQNSNSGGDGLNWNTAFNNLQDALALAEIGSEIWVAGGVYYPDVGTGQVDNDVFSTFNLLNGVKLYGGFNGTETEVGQRDPVTNVTVLSGDIDGNDVVNSDGVTANTDDLVGTNAYHVMTSLNSDSTTVIDGITITAGKAFGLNQDRSGSAIFCNASNLTLNQIVVQGNHSDAYAALWGCSPIASHSLFINNRTNYAGAVSTYNGTYTDSQFIGNRSHNSGAVFLVDNGQLNLTRVVIQNNFGNNRAVIESNSSDLNFNDVLFMGNYSGDSEGMIWLGGSTNSTFNNVTITGNQGTAVKSNITGNLEINNSILWNNADMNGAGTIDANITHTGIGTITINSSIIQGSGSSSAWVPTTLVDGGDNLDQDPLFILDTDPSNAPSTLGNARLDVGSPAINMGNNAYVTSTIDLYGNPRIQDTTVDMGASEFSSYSVSVTVSGLDAGTLVLQNNGADDLTFNNNGSQTFNIQVANTADYLVTVLTQPSTPLQLCTVSNGSGTVYGNNITDITVDCVLNYSVGVDVSGLANGVTLSVLNNSEALDVTSNGVTNFATALNDGSAYAVSITTQPTVPNQECLITSNNASGNIDTMDVVIDIECTTLQYTIGVDVSGLAQGNSVEFDNNGESLTVNADGQFNFVTALDDGSAYDVSVSSQPTSPNQMCSFVSGTGSVNGMDVLITVTCTTNQYFVGGMASGLANGNSVTLSLGAEDLAVNNNAAFVFINPLADETSYEVSISSQPTVPNQTCELMNETGTIAGNDVTDLEVNCTTHQYSIGGTVVGLHSGNNLVIQNNNGDDLMISSDGDFDFATPIDDLQPYNVTILNQPTNPIQNCELSSNTGNVSGGDIVSVMIMCDFGDDLIYRDGFE